MFRRKNRYRIMIVILSILLVLCIMRIEGCAFFSQHNTIERVMKVTLPDEYKIIDYDDKNHSLAIRIELSEEECTEFKEQIIADHIYDDEVLEHFPGLRFMYSFWNFEEENVIADYSLDVYHPNPSRKGFWSRRIYIVQENETFYLYMFSDIA